MLPQGATGRVVAADDPPAWEAGVAAVPGEPGEVRVVLEAASVA